MDINDITPLVSYTATAGQTSFTVPFEFFTEQDLVVTNNGVTLTYDATPADETEYSVTGASVEGGGSITLGGSGATLGDDIVIYRDIPIKRTADYPESGPFRVGSLNTEQAKQIAMMQQLEADIRRGLLSPKGETLGGLPDVTARANTVLAFDSNGDPIALLMADAEIALQAQQREFTATAGQTEFSFASDALSGFVEVFINGVLLPTSDYTHSGSTVTLNTGAALNDLVTIKGFVQGTPDAASALRDDLAASTGSSLIGKAGGGTVQDAIDIMAGLGATGDGVTDDTAVFKLVEATDAQVVNLAGRTYAVESIWTDPVNGVLLTKDYRNGTMLMDGRPLVFDSLHGVASSDILPMPKTPSAKKMGLFRKDANTYFVWSPLGGRYYAELQLGRTGSGVPFNWRETYIRQKLGIIAALDDHTYTGGWSDTASASYNLSSASTTAYIGGRAKQALAASDYVEIAYEGSGDIFVIFTGRTSGNYVNVLLNGGQDYLILPDDGAGNRYFDSYTATDLSFLQVVQIASGVPQGTHTIRLTVSATKNPSSSGNRYVHNCIAFSNDDLGPWSPETEPPLWESGQAIVTHQVRKFGNNYYYASNSGTTGATPPTHTSGSVSDGAVTWVYRAESGYDLTSHRYQATGSQLEYAYEIKPSGATVAEDVGGQLHGSETQTGFQFTVDNTNVSLPDNAWAIGSTVAVREAIDATHSQVGGGSTAVVRTVLARIFKPGLVSVRTEHELLTDAELGYFYPHMWPLLHYDGLLQKYGITEIWSAGDGWRQCADWYGVTNPFVGRTKDYSMVARGPCLQPNGAGGVPSAVPASLTAYFGVKIAPEGVDEYRQSGLRLFASKAMNTSGADVSSGGYSSMTSKIYFERNSTQSPQAYQSGDVIRSRADYHIAIEPAL